MDNPILGLDFGGVISKGHTTDDIMENVIQAVSSLSNKFFGKNIWIISRVDDDSSRRRVLDYMNRYNLWNLMNIPKNNARFCILRTDKGPIAKELSITHFVDDHTEVLHNMPSVRYRYALGTRMLELMEYPIVTGIRYCHNWNSVYNEISISLENQS